jgi:hypothetical protein
MPDLQWIMRHVFEYPDAARERGKKAREKILPHSWKRAAEIAGERLLALAG